MTVDSTVTVAAETSKTWSARWTWWASFLLLAGLGSTWALATPTFASPDEPSQVIRAWSAAHGQWLGREFDAAHVPERVDASALPHVWDYGTAVRAPETYEHWGKVGCVAYKPYATADCIGLDNGTRVVDQITYHARYFPAYYFVAGLPSLFTTPGAGQVFAMRMMGVLLAAGLIASAVVSTRATRAPTTAAAGIALALTPTALFLAASVNPSGLEIAAAIAVWCSGALLATTVVSGVERRVVDRVGIAAVALVVARPISPLWLALAGVVLAVIAGTSGLRLLWAARRARIWAAVIVVTTLVHVGWNVWRQAYDAGHYAGTPTSLPLSEVLNTSVGKGFDLVRQMVAVFGWLDTAAPTITLAVWLLGIGGIVALAVALTPRKWTLALGLTALLVVALPVALEAWQVRDIGFQWQGRYTLPLAVGLPVLAAFALSQDSVVQYARRRLVVLLGGALAVAQVAAFAQALRRYSVGDRGPIVFFSSASWNPPVPSLVLVILYGVLLLAFFAVLFLVGASIPVRQRGVARASASTESRVSSSM